MPSLNDQSDGACAAKVTTLLNEAGAGNSNASADLLPLVYEQLRALAGRRMRQERPDQTLQATALVHEAYLRLVDNAALVKLRYFAGLSTEEAAQALGMSVRTAGRAWAYARAWLYARITSA